MKVLTADAMGFCFGVRDALAIADEIEQPELVTIHGELVHNESVLHRLDARGFHRQSEDSRDRIPESPQVLITAHGISDSERERLQSQGKQLLDTTCPLVRRAHQAAAALAAEGRHVVVIGRPGHVEVRGLVGDLVDYSIVESDCDVRAWPHERLGVVCQTTTPPMLAADLHQQIQAKNPRADVRFVNTVCQPTIDRQRAVERLLPQVDAVIVVGGKNSNNTARLAELCRDGGVPAYHVQSAGDVDPSWFIGCSAVGLTAGTSTPDETIAEVTEAVRRIAPADEPARGTRTTGAWCRTFRRNAETQNPIPWAAVADLTDGEYRAVVRSMAVFQLGESGEGRHVLKCAERYGRRAGDPNYVLATTLFLREEQRHAALLGRFLDEAGAPRIGRAWSDALFRWLRHRAGLELTMTVLVTAEILAKIYYAALRDATACLALRAICDQILRDEVAHVRFQQERIIALQHQDPRCVRRLKQLLHAVLLTGTACVLWVGHRSVFRAAGMGVRSYWRRVWRESGQWFRHMDEAFTVLSEEPVIEPSRAAR